MAKKKELNFTFERFEGINNGLVEIPITNSLKAEPVHEKIVPEPVLPKKVAEKKAKRKENIVLPDYQYKGKEEVKPLVNVVPTSSPGSDYKYKHSPTKSQPKVVPTQPKVVPIQPKVAPIQPKVAPIQPKVVPIQPKVAPIQPKVAPIQPKVAPIQPKVAPIQPKVAPKNTPKRQKIVDSDINLSELGALKTKDEKILYLAMRGWSLKVEQRRNTLYHYATKYIGRKKKRIYLGSIN